MSRSRRRIVLLAAVASAALVAGMFAAPDPAAAAPARPRPAAGLPHARHGTKLSAGPHALPRVLGKQRSAAGEPGQAGLPSSGGYAFLLQLDQTSTLARYHQLAGRGRTAARAAAKQQYTQ